LRRVSALPGVQQAALAEAGPLSSRAEVETVDAPVDAPVHAPVKAGVDAVTRDFFDALGIPLVAGRRFGSSDTPDWRRVVTINEAFVRALFPGVNPIGRHFRQASSGKDMHREYEIVGVVADTHYYDVHAAPRPAFWHAMAQRPPYMPTLHVRTSVADTGPI